MGQAATLIIPRVHILSLRAVQCSLEAGGFQLLGGASRWLPAARDGRGTSCLLFLVPKSWCSVGSGPSVVCVRNSSDRRSVELHVQRHPNREVLFVDLCAWSSTTTAPNLKDCACLVDGRWSKEPEVMLIFIDKPMSTRGAVSFFRFDW